MVVNRKYKLIGQFVSHLSAVSARDLHLHFLDNLIRSSAVLLLYFTFLRIGQLTMQEQI